MQHMHMLRAAFESPRLESDIWPIIRWDLWNTMNNISNQSLYHPQSERYCFITSAVKKSKLFHLSGERTLIGPLKEPLASAALVLWRIVIVSPGNNYAILSVISWVVADTVCACRGSIGPCCWAAHGLTVPSPCICTNTPWRQVGSNYW